jgi:hypothetical protein
MLLSGRRDGCHLNASLQNVVDLLSRIMTMQSNRRQRFQPRIDEKLKAGCEDALTQSFFF